MNSVSDEAWELLEGLISVGAILESAAVSPKDLRVALDVVDRGEFDAQLRELLDGRLIVKIPPVSIEDSVRYFASIKHVADYAGVDEDAVRMQADHDDVPAADRVVTLEHNLPEYLRVSEGILELREAVRSVNDLADRDNISNALSAADALWRSSELRIIQIKIGVIMAIEAAGRALAATAKAVATALLIDSIKALVKSNTGIDLDRL